MSSRSVLGNVEARGRAHDYTETDSLADCDAVHVNKTDDNNDCITTDGV